MQATDKPAYLYQRQPHSTDRAAALLHLACTAFEIAGHRERLGKGFSLQCDLCRQFAATHLKTPLASINFTPPARTFSLHYCWVGKSRRFLVVCKYCARRVRAGGHTHKGEIIKWIAHVPSRQPTK